MNRDIHHKSIIDETIIRIKEKYPEMDTFLSLNYNDRHDVISTIITIHEETISEVSEDGIEVTLPYIGRLTIKEGKLIYEKILKEYLDENDLYKHELTNIDRTNITNTIRKEMLKRKLSNRELPNETKVLTFNPKFINK